MRPSTLWKSWRDLFSEDAPNEPHFDPVHLALILVACQVTVGLLFWLLWTAMVYEGGFCVGEGRIGNGVALIIIASLIEALRRADLRHARKSK